VLVSGSSDVGFEITFSEGNSRYGYGCYLFTLPSGELVYELYDSSSYILVGDKPYALEIYNPITGLWRKTQDLPFTYSPVYPTYYGPVVFPLDSNSIMVVNGTSSYRIDTQLGSYTTMTALGVSRTRAYAADPGSGSLAQDMDRNNLVFSASNGKFILVGHDFAYPNRLRITKYDPVADTWTDTSATWTAYFKYVNSAVKMSNGKILICSPFSGYQDLTKLMVVYDPVADTFTSIANTAALAYKHLIPLSNGKVLCIPDGAINPTYLAVFDPSNNTLTKLTSTANLYQQDSGYPIALSNGKVLVRKAAGGNTFRLFNPSDNSLSSEFSYVRGAQSVTTYAFECLVVVSRGLLVLGYGSQNVIGSASDYTANQFYDIDTANFYALDPGHYIRGWYHVPQAVSLSVTKNLLTGVILGTSTSDPDWKAKSLTTEIATF